MGWTLRLVETGSRCGSRHHNLFDLGEIDAPCELDAVGLTLAQAKDVLASLQQSVVALQEEALAENARAEISSIPQLRLKDYRVRHLDTLFGREAIKVPRPRLVRPRSRGSHYAGRPAPRSLDVGL